MIGSIPISSIISRSQAVSQFIRFSRRSSLRALARSISILLQSQKTVLKPMSIALRPIAILKWVLPVPTGPKSKRFSHCLINSQLLSSASFSSLMLDADRSKLSNVAGRGNGAREGLIFVPFSLRRYTTFCRKKRRTCLGVKPFVSACLSSSSRWLRMWPSLSLFRQLSRSSAARLNSFVLAAI